MKPCYTYGAYLPHHTCAEVVIRSECLNVNYKVTDQIYTPQRNLKKIKDVSVNYSISAFQAKKQLLREKRTGLHRRKMQTLQMSLLNSNLMENVLSTSKATLECTKALSEG